MRPCLLNMCPGSADQRLRHCGQILVVEGHYRPWTPVPGRTTLRIAGTVRTTGSARCSFHATDSRRQAPGGADAPAAAPVGVHQWYGDRVGEVVRVGHWGQSDSSSLRVEIDFAPGGPWSARESCQSARRSDYAVRGRTASTGSDRGDRRHLLSGLRGSGKKLGPITGSTAMRRQ